MESVIGVCSWSLQPTGPDELVERVRACGLSHVQLALDPLRTGAWDVGRTRSALADAGIEVVSGMMSMQGEDYSSLAAIKETGGVRPGRHWPANLAAARDNAKLAAKLGLELVSFHAGFLPHDANDPERGVLVERLRAIVDAFAEEGVTTAFETGQERADTLVGVLDQIERETVGVNFDPANMLLYRMGEPVEALALLGRWVRQIHVKDAVRSETPGEWGTEVAAGTGEVDWQAFFGVARLALDHEVHVELVREAGDDRVGDVKTARALLAEVLG